MLYKIFTDAATKSESIYSGVAFIVVAQNKFIHADSEIVTEPIIAKAEAFAVLHALQWVQNAGVVSSEDKLRVYTDSLYVYKFVKKSLTSKDGGNSLDTSECDEVIQRVHDVIQQLHCEVNIAKVVAHQLNKTPNSYVDRLARLELQKIV